MFKKSVLVSAAILATVSLAGCGSKASQDATQTTPPAQTKQASSQATSGIALPSDRPAFIGRVKDVANGQITINKAELPAQPQKGAPQGVAPQGDQGANQKGRGQGRGMKFSDQADTITIPASAQVVTGNPRGGNITAIKASDIKKDQLIRVWEKDGAINFVLVMDGNRNRSAQQQGGQQTVSGSNSQGK